jgi:GDP-4-dehydro-6-deoxy-D-mannose reductase
MPEKRILVTGAGGFVGGHLLALLRAHYPTDDVVAFAGDIRDAETVRAQIRHTQPWACIHLAAISSVAQARQDEAALWATNLHGTLHLAHAILAETPACSFIFASTADAYGASFRQGTAVDESVALAPLNPYAASKAAADLAIGALAAEGLRAIRLRPFNHTGPGQTEAFVVPAFARQIAMIAAGLQEPVLRVGDITPSRDFLDVRDVCAAYVSCLDMRESIPPGAIFNLSSGRAIRIGDVLNELLAQAGLAVDIIPEPSRKRLTDIAFACGDSRKIIAATGWKPTVPWAETLRDVLDDWQQRLPRPDSANIPAR